MKKLTITLAILTSLSSVILAGTFTEVHSIYCGAIIKLGPVGYPTWNPARILKEPSHGKVFIVATQFYPDSLVYKSDYGFLGVDTFIVECARATQISCDTGIYIMQVIGCPPISAFTEEHEITCDSQLLIPGLGFPTWATPEIVQAPSHGTSVILSGNPTDFDTLQYLPFPGFTGKDTVVVKCAHATQIICETGIYIITVSCANQNKERRQEDLLKIYPNPFQDFLTVESTTSLERLSIVMSEGKTVYENKPAQPFFKKQLYLTDLPEGIYFLSARGTAGEIMAKKIVHTRSKR